MQDTPYCDQQFDSGSNLGRSEVHLETPGDAVNAARDGQKAAPLTLNEFIQLRKELDRARQQITALQAQRGELEGAIRELTRKTPIDELTGLQNWHGFEQSLTSACAFASRHNLILSLIVLDLDEFQALNAACGEDAGDEVLRTLADILTGSTRMYDVVARESGGTFTVFLPSTDRSDAYRVANRLRQKLAAHPWPSRSVTASFGVTTLESAAVCAMELVDQARCAMRQAKREGRNRVVHFAEVRDRSLPSTGETGPANN